MMSGLEMGTEHTAASVELELPIQGYLMKDGKRDSYWLAVAEGEESRVDAKDKATVRHAFD